MSGFNAKFQVDGSGNWEIGLPADADKHDVLALGPVISGMKQFLLPTVADADAPIGLVPAELVDDPPNLTA